MTDHKISSSNVISYGVFESVELDSRTLVTKLPGLWLVLTTSNLKQQAGVAKLT